MGNCVRHHGDVTILSSIHIPRAGRLNSANTTYRSYEDLSPVTSSDSIQVEVEETTTVSRTEKKRRSRIFFKGKKKDKFHVTSSLLKSQDSGNILGEVPEILVTSPGGLCRKASAAAAAVTGHVMDENQNISHCVPFSEIDIPETNFGSFLLHQFEANGDGIAAIDSQSDRSYSYRDLAELAQRTGSALRKRGFRRGQTLFMISTNSIELPAILCAVLCSGGIFVAHDPNRVHMGLRRRVFEMEPACTIVITDAALADTVLREIRVATHHIEIFTIGYLEGFHPLAELQRDDGATFPFDVFTQPKLTCAVVLYSRDRPDVPIRFSHYSIMSNVLQIQKTMGLKRSAFLGCFLPLYHHFGLVGTLLHGICTGTTVVLVKEAILEHCYAAIIKYKPTIIHMTSEMAKTMFEDDLMSICDLSNLETLLCGTSPLAADIQAKIISKLGSTNVCQAYGSTETLLTHYGSNLDGTPHGSSGHLLPNTACMIVDETSNQSVRTDDRGKILVAGPQCRLRETHEIETRGIPKEKYPWTSTGDIGRIDNEGCLFVEATTPFRRISQHREQREFPHSSSE